MKHATLPAPTLSRRARRVLALASVLAIAPHVLFMPLWLALPGLGLALACAWAPPPALTRLTRFALHAVLFGSLILIGLYFRRFWGREPGVALLTVMVAAKLLEVRSPRDAMVVWCSAAVLLVAMTAFDQEMLSMAYLIAALIVFFVALDVIVDQADRHPLRVHAKRAAARMAMGVPIALILFVFFPRLAAPIWGFGESRSAKTGLSDRMRPGQISNLVSSSEVAFRVQFNGPLPPRSTLYWRGPVLDQFSTEGDEEAWLSGTQYAGRLINIAPEQFEQARTEYTVTLQPHNQRWLFALDLPAAFPKGGDFETTTNISAAQQLYANVPVREAVRYSVTSVLTNSYPPMRGDVLRQLGTGPTSVNPRARAWAEEQMRSVNGDPVKYAQILLRHINNKNFVYTTRPPTIARNVVDGFWFDTQRGFCEHYAGAFVFLMRAAGVPARVVTGYLGGEMNTQNNTLVVRQSEAHAWTEVLLEGQWRRIDPTAIIAPNRIERSLSEALPADERAGAALQEWPLLGAMRDAWDATQFAYTSWLIGYDRAQQLQAMAKLGLEGMHPGQWIAIAISALAISATALVALYLWREKRSARPTDEVERLWLTFIRRIGKSKIAIPAHATPREVAQSVARARPTYADAVHAFTLAVEKTRYSPERDAQTVRLAFAKLPKRFST